MVNVLNEYGFSFDSAGTDADLHDIQSNYWSAGGLFDVLVNSAGRIVGSVGLFRVSCSTCELRKMYLIRELRGHGLGRLLLEDALRHATEFGFKRIVLETASILQDAARLYESYGFRRYKSDHLSSRCDTAYYLDICK